MVVAFCDSVPKAASSLIGANSRIFSNFNPRTTKLHILGFLVVGSFLAWLVFFFFFLDYVYMSVLVKFEKRKKENTYFQLECCHRQAGGGGQLLGWLQEAWSMLLVDCGMSLVIDLWRCLWIVSGDMEV